MSDPITFTVFADATPPLTERVILLNFGMLMAERGHTFRYLPSLMSDWVKEGAVNQDPDCIVDLTDASEGEKEKALFVVKRVAPYLWGPGFREHFYDNAEAYRDAGRVLLTHKGEVQVQRVITWVGEEDTPPPLVKLARHLNIPCLNYANPKTQARLQDWVMDNSLLF